MGYHAPVELEAALFKAFARAGMAAVEYGHVVLRGHGVDGVEERQEVLLGVDILLAVGRQKDVAAFFQTEATEDVGGFNVGQVVVKHFGHRGAAYVGALGSYTAGVEVAAGMLRVADIDVGDDVDDAAVGLLGQALVEATVASFHVEDRDM